MYDTSDIFKVYFQKKFPYHSTKDHLYKKDDKRRRRFSILSKISVITVLIYLFVLPVFYGAILSELTAVFYRSVIPANAVFYPPDWLMYIITGLLLMLSTIIWLHEWTFRIFLQNDYEEFEDYYNSRQEYDNKKAGIALAKIGLVCTLISLPFILGSRVVLYKDNITVKLFYNPTAHEYSYNDIDDIVLYEHHQNRKGAIRPGKHYVVKFRDGYEFYIGHYASDKEEMKNIANVISARAGKPIVNRDVDYFDADIEPDDLKKNTGEFSDSPALHQH